MCLTYTHWIVCLCESALRVLNQRIELFQKTCLLHIIYLLLVSLYYLLGALFMDQDPINLGSVQIEHKEGPCPKEFTI